MPVDTAQKRLSIVGLGLPFRGLPAVPDGSIDRLAPLFLYTGVPATIPPSGGTLGPSVAGTAANSIGISVSWANVGNTTVSDDTYATASLDAGLGPPFDRSRRLNLTAFTPSLVLPAGAIRDGITVTVERKASVISEVRDTTVQIISGGAWVGDNKASGATWPTSDAVATYGGAADDWGLDPDLVIDATFGVSIAVETVGAGAVVASIDLVTITVTYHLPPAGPALHTLSHMAVAVHTLSHAQAGLHTLSHAPVAVHTFTHGRV